MTTEHSDSPVREPLKETVKRMELRPGITEPTTIIVPPTNPKKHHWIHAQRHPGKHPSTIPAATPLNSMAFIQAIDRDPESVCRSCWEQFFTT